MASDNSTSLLEGRVYRERKSLKEAANTIIRALEVRLTSAQKSDEREIQKRDIGQSHVEHLRRKFTEITGDSTVDYNTKYQDSNSANALLELQAAEARFKILHSKQVKLQSDKWTSVIDDFNEFITSGDVIPKNIAHIIPNKSTIESLLIPLWSERLIHYGRELDRHVDTLMQDVIKHPFGVEKSSRNPFKWLWSPFKWVGLDRPIAETLDSLLKLREDVRAYEVDVEHYIHNAAVAGAAADVLPVTQMLNEVGKTYQRTFDLAVVKLNAVGAGKVSATNITVAVFALFVSVLALVASVAGVWLTWLSVTNSQEKADLPTPTTTTVEAPTAPGE